MTTWTLDNKNFTDAGVVFNQLGVAFNQLGIMFGGINLTIWTLDTK